MKLWIFILSLLLINCHDKTSYMNVIYYKDGKSTKIDLKKLDLKSLHSDLKKLVEGITEDLRIVTDEERLNEIRSEDEIIEILFNEKQSVMNPENGEIVFDKILIPISGDFSTTEDVSDGVVFIGLHQYDAAPYLLPGGRQIILSVRKKIIGY
ncbi:MAG TPA: hypothetical protein PLT92_00095 [Ignavibacteriaceae bacterium]|nr:hypothetical protein [Ignavibacteriaceae bacterium]HOJ16943.1 hypothetical protein [Ignavibacteriaceae bacterium]HPO56682.1 hypothetical protein [Ignavibacteriaceae bacterium]